MKGLTQVSPYWGKGGATLRSLSLLLLLTQFTLRFWPQQPRVCVSSVWNSPPCLGWAAPTALLAVLGCARPLGQVHKRFPLCDATCSLLDVYYTSVQFHKAPACNKTLLHVWGLKEINGSSLGMHILLRCLLQMKWSWGKTLTSCRVIKGILSFLSDINRKKPLTKSIKFLFPNEFALTIY